MTSVVTAGAVFSLVPDPRFETRRMASEEVRGPNRSRRSGLVFAWVLKFISYPDVITACIYLLMNRSA